MAEAFKPPRPRLRQRRSETAERLLDGAFDIFSDRGFDGASIDAICQRVGMTRGAFYSNYASKEDLFCAAVEQEMRRFADRLRRLWAGAADQADPLAAAVTRYVMTELNDRRWCLMIGEFRLLAARIPHLGSLYREISARYFALLGQRIAELADSAGLSLTVEPAEAGEIWAALAEAASWRVILADESIEGSVGDSLKQVLLTRTRPKRGLLA